MVKLPFLCKRSYSSSWPGIFLFLFARRNRFQNLSARSKVERRQRMMAKPYGTYVQVIQDDEAVQSRYVQVPSNKSRIDLFLVSSFYGLKKVTKTDIQKITHHDAPEVNISGFQAATEGTKHKKWSSKLTASNDIIYSWMTLPPVKLRGCWR